MKSCGSFSAGVSMGMTLWHISRGILLKAKNTEDPATGTILQVKYYNALLLHQVLYHSRSITEDAKKNIFHLAAVEGRYRYVEIIIQHTENTNEALARALVDAAKEGCAPIILMLEAAGANVNAAI